ncbi:MAG: prepilin-type N-terminal cleavage/methylation domain-containing protein [Kiritimatiellae bacterium]|nr:prepilin-type N-terminal cleavage/methylation domain-containing protein [Kiritimatiellia bacterium]MDD5522261.1 prepilin-type N-terminal cleavage/methylation domain-containing protein [Kiritimatiellia bacterium]
MKLLRNNSKGFSLVEVNLAIFLVAAGLLILFSLFPLGLRESEMGIADTQESMFADFVLNAMEGSSMTKTNWSEWQSAWPAGSRVLDTPEVYVALLNEEPRRVEDFPSGSGNTIKYTLTVDSYPLNSNGYRKRAVLLVRSGKYGKFSQTTRCYMTEFVYMGM